MFSLFAWFLAAGCGTLALIFVWGVISVSEDELKLAVILMVPLTLLAFSLTGVAYLKAIVTGVVLFWGVCP